MKNLAGETSESLYDLKQYIRLFECKHGWLYRIRSRNLVMGVFRNDRRGFVGIREKFEHKYLFVEYHWDTGPPFGTVKPLECLEPCPISNLDEYIETEGKQLETNTELFEYLKQKGGEPPHWVDQRKHLEDIQMLLKKQDQQRRKR